MPGFINGVRYQTGSDQYDLVKDSFLHAQSDAQQALDAAKAATDELAGVIDPVIVNEFVNNWPAVASEDAAVAALVASGASATRAALTRTGALPVGQGELCINAHDHGALGDGVTDDTAALQSALAAAITQGRELFIPDGHYILSATLIASSDRVAIRGAAETVLDWQTSGVDGISITQNDRNASCNISDLVLLSGATGLGTAIRYENLTENRGEMRTRTIERCRIFAAAFYGYSGNSNSEWGTCIHIENSPMHVVRDCNLMGANAATHPSPAYPYGFPRETVGVRIIRCNEVRVEDCRIHSRKYGVWTSGNSEGTRIIGSYIVQAYIGARWTAESAANDFPSNHAVIESSHIAATYRCVSLHEGTPYVTQSHQILGCHFLRSQRAPDAPMVYIELGPVGPTRILGNSFLNAQPTAAWEQDIGITGYESHPGETGTVNISDNVFSGIGVFIDTPSLPRVKVSGNIFRDLFGVPALDAIKGSTANTPWVSGNRGDRLYPPGVPASPTVQDVVDALKKAGIVNQDT